jgi:formylglycine-generating enzyme required for sulfatase activity
MSWNDAKAYAQWVSEVTGKTYRLMSEAEAEYVARGTTEANPKQPRYFFGNDEKELCTYANILVHVLGKTVGPCKKGYTLTAPVGSFKPNMFGLYDVIGNVSSWTEDCWNGNYDGAPTDGSAWTVGECGSRVLRGGSVVDDPEDLRAASRERTATGDRFGGYGIRLTRTLLH